MPQQFVVPQFIDAEAKLLGPITARQFVILLVTTLLGAIVYGLADRTLFIIIASPIALIGLTLAFVKVNGQNFHFFMLNIIMTFRKPRLRVWSRILDPEYLKQFVNKEIVIPKKIIPHKEFVRSSRLNELSLIVNTGGEYRPDADDVV